MLNSIHPPKKSRKKLPYQKSDAVRELEQLADTEARLKHPTCPHLAPRKYRDDTANNLTQCITAYLKIKDVFASRLNNMGVYDHKSRKYRPGTSRKGLPDILATYKGRSLFIEVKHGRDKMSKHQEQIRQEQEGSGGVYFIAQNFGAFKEWFDNLQ